MLFAVSIPTAAATEVNEKVGLYKVTFTVPGERNFYYEISDPSPFFGKEKFAGMNGTGCGLKTMDKNTNEHLDIVIASYDTPVAQAVRKIFADSDNPDWMENNPIHGMISIYYNIIVGYSSYVVVDEYILVSLYSNMSQNAIRAIARTLHIERVGVNQTSQHDTTNTTSIPFRTATIPAQTTIQSGGYPANRDTKVYHEPGCAWADKIEPENLIGFNSPQDAEAEGYRHCEKCQ